MVQRVFLVLILTVSSYCVSAQYMQRPDFYISNPDVSLDAKDYYSGVFSANDARAYSILDSVFTENATTRPFYIFLACRMLTEADGDLLAELNIICRYIAELYPSSLVSVLFAKEVSNTNNYKDLWAQRIAVEVRISCSADLMQCFKRSRILALQNCELQYKNKIEVLYNMVRKELNLFQQG